MKLAYTLPVIQSHHFNRYACTCNCNYSPFYFDVGLACISRCMMTYLHMLAQQRYSMKLRPLTHVSTILKIVITTKGQKNSL